MTNMTDLATSDLNVKALLTAFYLNQSMKHFNQFLNTGSKCSYSKKMLSIEEKWAFKNKITN